MLIRIILFSYEQMFVTIFKSNFYIVSDLNFSSFEARPVVI